MAVSCPPVWGQSDDGDINQLLSSPLISPEQAEVMRLMDEISKLSQTEPNSPKIQQMMEQLDANMVQLEQQMQQAPQMTPPPLPSSPAKKTEEVSPRSRLKHPRERMAEERRKMRERRMRERRKADTPSRAQRVAPSPSSGRSGGSSTGGDPLEALIPRELREEMKREREAHEDRVRSMQTAEQSSPSLSRPGSAEATPSAETNESVTVTPVESAPELDDEALTGDDEEYAEMEPPSGEDILTDDSIVKLTLKDDLLDINMLVETVGKELGFTFLYDSASGLSGQYRLQQYGDIRRRDLLPLLESILSFQQKIMVREDPFIRIINRSDSTKKAEPPIGIGPEMPQIRPGDTIVVQIVEIQYANLSDVQNVLQRFTTDPQALVPIPNTNYLTITEYASRVPRLLDIIALLDQPGPEKRLESITVEHIAVQDAITQVGQLLKDLGSEQAADGLQPVTPPRGSPRRPRRSTRRTRSMPSTSGGSEDEGPIMHADERTNRMFVIGTDEQIAQTQQLLSLLDVAEPSAEIRIEPIHIQHVVAGDIADQLTKLIDALLKQGDESSGLSSSPGGESKENQPQPRRTPRSSRTSRGRDSGLIRAGEDGPFIMPDERTNRLIIVGNQTQIDRISDLLALLDIESDDYTDAYIETYLLQFVEASEALKILDRLQVTKAERAPARQRARSSSRRTASGAESAVQGLPNEEDYEISAAVQESTNRLFILATKPQHETIEEILSHVDIEPNEAMGAIRVYFLENRDPEDVADMLIDLMESEQTNASENVKIPGKEGAPKIFPLADIYGVAVRGSAKQHQDIEEILKILDRRLPQVLVEAILVQVSASDGLDLGVSMQNVYDIGGTRNSSRNVSGQSPFMLGSQSVSDAGILTGTGATLAFLTDDLVYATLEAIEEKQNSKIVSMPRILVNDNKEGTITSERQEPTTSSTIQPGSDTPIVTFKGYESAGTTLKIKPHISGGDSLQLEIDLQVNSFEGEGQNNVPPPKNSNQINTEILVPNDSTIVLGGLTSQTNSVTANQIPLLGDIPLLGALFRNVGRDESESVLYVFVKANIVRSGVDDFPNFEDLDRLSEKHKSRLRRTEEQYKELPVIPGLPNKLGEETRSVLDDPDIFD